MGDSFNDIFQNCICTLKIQYDQINDQSPPKPISSFTMDNFWLQLLSSVKTISHEITKLSLLYSKPPAPGKNAIKEMLQTIEGAIVEMYNVFLTLPKEKGIALRKEVFKAVHRINLDIITVLKSIKDNGINIEQDRMRITGLIWEACDCIEKLPKTNLQVTCKIVHSEEQLVVDAIQEIEGEVKADVAAASLPDLDNTDRWSNQDRELIFPCIGLIKTARSCLKKVFHALKNKGNCNSDENIAELDQLIVTVNDLSPAIDDFVTTVYPPMNKEGVKNGALQVVNKIEAILKLIQKSHFITEEDSQWVDFLLKAIDHNNNRLQPLLALK